MFLLNKLPLFQNYPCNRKGGIYFIFDAAAFVLLKAYTIQQPLKKYGVSGQEKKASIDVSI